MLEHEADLASPAQRQRIRPSSNDTSARERPVAPRVNPHPQQRVLPEPEGSEAGAKQSPSPDPEIDMSRAGRRRNFLRV